MTSPRERKPNFSDEQIYTMIEGIQRYKDILLTRENTNTSNAKKNQRWDEIAEMVNKVNPTGVYRTAADIRKKWKDLLYRAKKEYPDIVNPQRKGNISHFSELVVDIYGRGSKMFMGLDNDSDIIGRSEDSRDAMDHLDDSWADGDEDSEMGLSGRRKPNFSDEEIYTLLEEFYKHREVLVPRLCNSSSNKEKMGKWEEIKTAVNAKRKGGPKRTAKDVRKKWIDLLHRAKKDFQERDRSKMSPYSEVIIEICGKDAPLFNGLDFGESFDMPEGTSPDDSNASGVKPESLAGNFEDEEEEGEEEEEEEDEEEEAGTSGEQEGQVEKPEEENFPSRVKRNNPDDDEYKPKKKRRSSESTTKIDSSLQRTLILAKLESVEIEKLKMEADLERIKMEKSKLKAEKELIERQKLLVNLQISQLQKELAVSDNEGQKQAANSEKTE